MYKRQVFPIDRAGIVGADGETHQGVYDISYLSHMPNMTILSPATLDQLEYMLDFAINKFNAPIAIRYPCLLYTSNVIYTRNGEQISTDIVPNLK